MKTVHLAIDLQRLFLANLEPQSFAKNLCARIAVFSQRLWRANIPTILIAYGNMPSAAFYPENPPTRLEIHHALRELSLPCFEKTRPSAFSIRNGVWAWQEKEEKLHDILTSMSVERLLFSGVSTAVCVAATMQDALTLGYACTGIVNLMGEESAKKRENLSPEWHKEKLESLIQDPKLELRSCFSALAPNKNGGRIAPAAASLG